MLAYLLFTALSAIASSAQTTTAMKMPTPPGLTYLYTLNCSLAAPIEIGAGPRGTRIAIPIIGGEFKGPKLSGKVLNLGADWGLVDSKGTFSADTRYNLKTDDGANIYIQTSGPAQPDGHLHLRMIFETGSEKYYWLNNIVAVGILTTGNNWVAIDGWQLLSPRNATAGKCFFGGFRVGHLSNMLLAYHSCALIHCESIMPNPTGRRLPAMNAHVFVKGGSIVSVLNCA